MAHREKKKKPTCGTAAASGLRTKQHRRGKVQLLGITSIHESKCGETGAQDSAGQTEAPEESGLEKRNIPAEREEEAVCSKAEERQASWPDSRAKS